MGKTAVKGKSWGTRSSGRGSALLSGRCFWMDSTATAAVEYTMALALTVAVVIDAVQFLSPFIANHGRNFVDRVSGTTLVSSVEISPL